ncbi:hypothetical protein ACFT4A_42270 [Streptomyces sp. NPDC057099]|uniref:hypothetical protein n=1 Tax=Streptomyces sp. NPDC057099 TaxID=3346019 RepID=UPI0036371797
MSRLRRPLALGRGAAGVCPVDVRPGDERPARVAARIRGWSREPGAGAGSSVNVPAGGRRKAARALERRRRTAG